jgi:hypothetical protein
LVKSARACPFWAQRRRPLEPPATVLTAIATYRQDQWETLLAAAADRDTMDETWEEWNAGSRPIYRTSSFCFR